MWTWLGREFQQRNKCSLTHVQPELGVGCREGPEGEAGPGSLPAHRFSQPRLPETSLSYPRCQSSGDLGVEISKGKI